MRRQNLKIHLVFILAFLLGFLGANLIRIVSAHGGDISLIHGCVRPLTGLLRIIGASEVCGQNETALDWRIQGEPGSAGPPGPPGPAGSEDFGFICSGLGDGGCRFDELVGDRFAGKDLTNAYIPRSRWDRVNFESTIFPNAVMREAAFAQVNMKNADLRGANVQGINLYSSDLTNANLMDLYILSATIVDTDLTNANLERVTFETSNLSGTNLNGANLTDTTWIGTICPDGTNSDDNGNTCLGHLTP